MDPIDSAIDEFNKGIKLEDEGKSNNDLSKLNQAATHYFAGCLLLKVHIKNQDSMGINEKNFLEDKISEYDGRGKRLIQLIRGQPSELIEGNKVSTIRHHSQDLHNYQTKQLNNKSHEITESSPSYTRPPASTVIENKNRNQIAFISGSFLNSTRSLSMMPIVEAFPVALEDECHFKKEKVEDKSYQQICEEAESLFNTASEYDNTFFPNQLNQLRQISHAKDLYIVAAQSFLNVLKILDYDLKEEGEKKQASTKEKCSFYEQVKAYRDYLQQRVENILGN